MSAKQDIVATRIQTALTDPLSRLGLDVEAVEITPAGKRRVLRVAVDTDGGVTLDDVAEATRAVNEVLDASDVMGEQPYTLEVTSRGVDRPLTLPRHWRRNVDRLVKINLRDPGAEGGTILGRILDSDDDGVRVDVDGTPRRVAYAEITKALVQIEFNRRPGTSRDAETAPGDGSDEEGDA